MLMLTVVLDLANGCFRPCQTVAHSLFPTL